LEGGIGQDLLNGGLGDDTLDGDEGDDQLFGREGDDILQGGIGRDVLSGGEGDDHLTGYVLDDNGDDVDDFDYLNGGDGDDTLIIGEGDVATGGEGADIFALGDWIDGEAAELVDYDSSEDQIMIVYEGDPPEVELRTNADQPSLSEIVVDGAVIGKMPTDLAPDVSDLVLVAAEDAAVLSLS
jgi:Ca2+-binding RTX toxin-like protein